MKFLNGDDTSVVPPGCCCAVVFIIAVRFACFFSELSKELDVIHLNERVKVNICRTSPMPGAVLNTLYTFSHLICTRILLREVVLSLLYRTGSERCSS